MLGLTSILAGAWVEGMVEEDGQDAGELEEGEDISKNSAFGPASPSTPSTPMAISHKKSWVRIENGREIKCWTFPEKLELEIIYTKSWASKIPTLWLTSTRERIWQVTDQKYCEGKVLKLNMDIILQSRRVGAPKWIRIFGLVKLANVSTTLFFSVSYLLVLPLLFTLFLFFSIDDEDERNSYRSFDNGMLRTFYINFISSNWEFSAEYSKIYFI